jgi:hypothetical protein
MHTHQQHGWAACVYWARGSANNQGFEAEMYRCSFYILSRIVAAAPTMIILLAAALLLLQVVVLDVFQVFPITKRTTTTILVVDFGSVFMAARGSN